MGNRCSELCEPCLRCFHRGNNHPQNEETNSGEPTSNFSSINNNKFMIPKDYFNIIKQIKEILREDTSLWTTYQLFLQNSKSFFNKLLSSLKSYKKLSVVDHIPFETIFQTETVFPKKYPRKFILEIQKLVFCSPMKNLKTQGFSKPYIEIEIYPNEKKQPDRVVFFQTKTGEPIDNPEWNEVFVYEFENEDIKETGKFIISLYYIENSILSGKKLIDKKYTFEFTELANQRVNEKVIKLKEKDNSELGGEIYLRVQMVYNYERFLADWINELEVKLEIIERILKINAEILQTPPKNHRNSSEFKQKFTYPNIGNENYIEMTTISNHDENSNEETLRKNDITRSPILFGTKAPNALRIEDFCLESVEGSAKDKNEYFDNHFFMK